MTIRLYVINCGARVLLGTVEGQGICAPDAGVNLKKQVPLTEHASFVIYRCFFPLKTVVYDEGFSDLFLRDLALQRFMFSPTNTCYL